MAVLTPSTPRRADLVLRPFGQNGGFVVKDPRTGQYFNLDAPEAYLFQRLDGTHSVEEIRESFEAEFGETLSAEEFEEFLEVARSQNFLAAPHEAETPVPESTPTELEKAPIPPTKNAKPTGGLGFKGRAVSVLFLRRSLVDPDRFLTWLAPRLAFLWTRTFAALSAAAILWACFLLGANWAEFKEYIFENLRWETVALAWCTIIFATALHELAHGLTCKRFGGEVHEIGVLLLFFLPCLYCNVSDAWLIRDKSKRLLVTLAGGYCDLCLFALAVFLWRVTLPDTLLYHIAWIVVSVCGFRFFFNFFPLFKLDGYYLLSDWLEVPNLRQRAQDHLAANVRWLLWGAERPEREKRGRFLLAFGLASLAFSVFYISVMLWSLSHFAVYKVGVLGLIPIAFLASLAVPGLFMGFSRGEMSAMFYKRHKRLLIWLGALGAVAALLIFVRVPDRASGTFKVRPASRIELRAPVSGFLQMVYFDEGERVGSGEAIAVLEIPDLQSRLAQKGAEIREVEAKLRLLEVGPRREELVEQRHRIERADAWRDLAVKDLERKKAALVEELARIDKQIAQSKTQFDFAKEALERGQELLDKKAVALDRYRDLKKDLALQQSQWEQAVAFKNERLVIGVLEQENELARREKDLADAHSTLKLLEAGSRSEEIQAEKARLARMVEEKRYLEQLQEKIRLSSPIRGQVTTPRLREKIGHYFKEGDLICEIEEPDVLEAEVTLEEQQISGVRPEQAVDFKARSLPFDLFKGRVSRVAPLAIAGKVQSSIVVTCAIDERPAALRSGMTGYARIECGSCSLGSSLFSRILQFVRTEYWW